MPPSPSSDLAEGERLVPPSGLFTNPAPYLTWEIWQRDLAVMAVVFAGLSVVVWLVLHFVGHAHARSIVWARLSVTLAMATAAVSLWVVGSPPALALSTSALPAAVAAQIAHQASADPSSVSNPAWAQRATQDLLAHYGDYVLGKYAPSLPPGYRMVLLDVPGQSSLTPLLTHGNTAPLDSIAEEVVTTLTGNLPESVLERIALADQTAVGLVEGTAITAYRHSPVVMIAVFVKAHG